MYILNFPSPARYCPHPFFMMHSYTSYTRTYRICTCCKPWGMWLYTVPGGCEVYAHTVPGGCVRCTHILYLVVVWGLHIYCTWWLCEVYVHTYCTWWLCEACTHTVPCAAASVADPIITNASLMNMSKEISHSYWHGSSFDDIHSVRSKLAGEWLTSVLL